MLIATALLNMLESIDFPELTDELRSQFSKQINASRLGMTPNPRDSTGENKDLLHAMLVCAWIQAQQVYGVGEDAAFDWTPRFKKESPSQIGRIPGEQIKFGVGLGPDLISWEDVFYDICHESLHLLNPVIDVNSTPVCTLEEGCAVKFAEQMYEKHIRPYCSENPATSPLRGGSNQYRSAYLAANKIPNHALHLVRKKFGKFSTINDTLEFTKLVEQYVTEEEIELLINPFSY